MKNLKQDNGLKRNSIDKFYTKKEIVKLCIKSIKKNIDIDEENDLIIEPSAGNGSFIEYIKKITKNYKFYDLEPEHKDIEKKDFFSINIENLSKKYNNIHIIGNPPFGRQSSTAKKFIKKCCIFSKTISFILPKSFKKDSMKNSFDKHYHLIDEFDLPKNSFLVNDKEYDVPCIFQIWKYEKTKRKSIVKEIPKNYSFVKKDEKPDISFRRVGVNAGNIMTEIDNKSIQSHYFIKFDNDPEKNIEKLKNISFEFNNTVGPKSISKQELIKEFNKLLK